ncbi:MOSC domain protein [Natronomonas pharaonis DSM 2160]|uniref:MOSC domain protein n=1 Tax=Natronomonas pharaonis (strain ATCC 35678 / DSM 2160 / CIP 103997 / JCM 8858 / NBRC 14720 / NCIMB 2260 / Gabara) TaxID=348780 RepID=A0A1U7EYJ3_NATPD|nr:MOSC domain-containing protein [Natronomonas pharaonis]CAI50298.1 MOSC domain protein [Natronomonas pharaonis DSM 2160]
MNADALAADHPVVSPAAADPHLQTIARFPVKSLDAEYPETARLVPSGALFGDREWAILDRPPEAPYDPTAADVGGSGDYVNGKKTAAVHRLRSTFHSREDGGPAVTLRRHDDPVSDARRFRLYDGRTGGNRAGGDAQTECHADLDAWLSSYFDRPVSVRWDGGGQHDDRTFHGPTVVSTATLREVAAWFDITVESARRRFRANLEIGGVPPFWEDRLFTDEGRAVAVRVGEATIEGYHPCQRCVVPSRDPDTGEETAGFRETFIGRRRETLPPWTDCDRFDHPFRLMVNTRVPEESAGCDIRVGDAVEILGDRPVAP